MLAIFPPSSYLEAVEALWPLYPFFPFGPRRNLSVTLFSILHLLVNISESSNCDKEVIYKVELNFRRTKMLGTILIGGMVWPRQFASVCDVS